MGSLFCILLVYFIDCGSGLKSLEKVMESPVIRVKSLTGREFIEVNAVLFLEKIKLVE